uniref:C-type lectin domain-containing protein n=1 Tax=Periophthalmus magnuspinnatus TaxID=409849 RepID=A0A3B3Z798_9GOBI
VISAGTASTAQTAQKMWGALLLLLWVLSGMAWGTQPTGGYCIGNSCFALFEMVVDFSRAQDICSQHRGHLMTVRSSVDHDSLSLLLGNSSGQHWIGLHLPKGCPDLTVDLRGFQWVTKDTTSNFLNWADTPSDSCSSSSPRCIFVSNDDKFLWHEDLCKNPKNGFLCEYSFHDMCPSFKNTEIQGGGCEHKCTRTPENGPVCYCPAGFIVNSTNDRTCELATDDPCLQLNCEHACYKYLSSFLCTCNEGFVLADDMKSFCMDIDECEYESCEQFCENSYGGFECFCKRGFTLVDGFKCVKEEIDGATPTEVTKVTEGMEVVTVAPTHRPSAVSVGGLVGIIICTVFFVLLALFLLHRILYSKRKTGSPVTLKALLT